MMNILVAGAGYLGLPLAVSLKEEGHQVYGWVASQSSAEVLAGCGIKPVCGDLSDRKIWQGTSIFWDAIFYCASTSGGGVEAYQRVHREGLDHALEFLAPSGRVFYTSSTSVYGQNDGSAVDESSPAQPLAEGSKILVEAEEKVLRRKGQVLRLAGIYGLGRCVYLKKLREDRASISGDGTKWVNQIHRDDAVAALRFLWKGREPSQVWNVSDNEPVSVRELYQWICQETGLPMPEAGGEVRAGKRGLTNKRIINEKLRRAGWQPQYPTFREGYRELLDDSSSGCSPGR